MKKIILSLVAVAIAFASINAQGSKAPAKKSPEQRIERYYTNLNAEYGLNEIQKPKVREILTKREHLRDDLRIQYAGNNVAFLEANKKMMAESDKQIIALLTPEQIQKQKQNHEAALQKNIDSSKKK